MKIKCEDVNESYCKLEFNIEDPYKLAEMKVLMADQLSAFTEGYKFNPSFRAGLWDGKKKYYKLIGDMMVFPKGMWKYLDRKIKKNYPEIEFEYKSETTFKQITKEEFDVFLESLKLPFQPYDYQYDAAFESINSGRMTIGAATSAGKSFIIYIIFRWMLSQEIKTMLVVPNVMLVNQMYQDFIDYGFEDIEEYIIRIGGEHCKTIEEKRELFADNLDGGMNIISTWQSLYNSPDLFSTIGCIIVDEVHNAKSEVFSDIILPGAVSSKYRFGLTGTMPSGYADKLSILGAIGPHKRFVNAQGLIDRGLATPVEIKMLFLNYNQEDKELMKKIKKYPDEIKFIDNHEERNNLIAKYTNKIAQSGNTLVMFTKVDHGRILLENYLKSKFGIDNLKFLDKVTPKVLESVDESTEKIFVNTELNKRQLGYISKAGLNPDIFEPLSKYDVFLIYGGIADEEREEIRKILETKEDAVVYASFGTMSTGVSIKRIHNIILASTTKSPIRLQQTVGRGMRLHDLKEWVKIWDFIDDFSRVSKTSGNIIESSKNHCLKHGDERMSLYLDNGYPIAEVEIQVK
jgi:superfamily II DNA or RNA helicase